MKPNLMKAMAGGFAGTVLMTFMMHFVAQMMLGHPMEMAAMLGGMMGGNWLLGMAAHFMNGVITKSFLRVHSLKTWPTSLRPTS
jgi:hypothetical protein